MTNVARIHRVRKSRRAILQPRRFQWVDHRTDRRIRLARKAASLGWSFNWNPPALAPHIDFETARLYRDALAILAAYKITPIRPYRPSDSGKDFNWTGYLEDLVAASPTPEPKRNSQAPKPQPRPIAPRSRAKPSTSFTLDELRDLGYYPGCRYRTPLLMILRRTGTRYLWWAPCRGSNPKCETCPEYARKLDSYRLERALPRWGVPVYWYGANLTGSEVHNIFSTNAARTDDLYVVIPMRKAGRYGVASTRRVKGYLITALDLDPQAMREWVRALDRKRSDARITGSDFWHGRRLERRSTARNQCWRWRHVRAKWEKRGVRFADDGKLKRVYPLVGELNYVSWVIFDFECGPWEDVKRAKLAANKLRKRNELRAK